MQRYSPGSGFPNMLLVGTYYIPPVGREIEVGSWYEGKLRALLKGYAAIRRAMPANAEGLVATADARQLDLPSDSIDYIFTDPPYADAVQYGELNFVWESWLGGMPDWHGDEIVVNRSRGKDADDWARAMRAAMGECHRVLKPGRWLSLCYHDTSARRWAMLQDLMRDAGFVIDSAAAAGSIETGQKSFNQWMSNKATKRDLVISFRKPRPGHDRRHRPGRPWSSKRPPGRFSASIWPNMAARRRIDCTTPWSATWSAWARCNPSILRPVAKRGGGRRQRGPARSEPALETETLMTEHRSPAFRRKLRQETA